MVNSRQVPGLLVQVGSCHSRFGQTLLDRPRYARVSWDSKESLRQVMAAVDMHDKGSRYTWLQRICISHL